MPAESNYPPVDIPDVGLWDFLFARKELPFPEDKSENLVICILRYVLIRCIRGFHRRRLESIIHFCPGQGHCNSIWSRPSGAMGLAEGRRSGLVHTKLHRHACNRLGHSFRWWDHLSRQPCIHGGRASFPIAEQRLQSFGHPASPDRKCQESGSENRTA